MLPARSPAPPPKFSSRASAPRPRTSASALVGVMLPHYSPMKGAGELPGAACAVSRPHRSRHRARARRQPARFIRVAPRSQLAANRGRLPQTTARADRVPPRRLPTRSRLQPHRTFTRDARGVRVWLLGSSMWSAAAAAQLGLLYAFAHFIDPTHPRAAIEYYRTHFKPSTSSPHPLRFGNQRDIRAD